MEMHQVRYFVALAETLNFTRAAERCNVSQPSLTRAIKLLEDEMGGPLFNRERNQTHLTELGRTTEPHLRELLRQAQAARLRARDFAQLRAASLKLGVTRSVPLAPLTMSLQRFATDYPETDIRLQEDAGPALGEALRRGDLEVIMVLEADADPEEFHLYRLGESLPMVAMPAAHRLAQHAEVPLAALADEEVVCVEQCVFWHRLEARLRESGIDKRPRIIVDTVDRIREVVASGLGVALLAAGHELHGGVTGRPLEAFDGGHQLTLATRRGRLYSPPVKAFVDIALRPPRQPSAAAAPAA